VTRRPTRSITAALGLLAALMAMAGCEGTWAKTASPIAGDLGAAYASQVRADEALAADERAARLGHAEAFVAYTEAGQREQALSVWTEPPALLRERFVAYTRSALPMYQGPAGQAAAAADRNGARLMNDLFGLPDDQGVGPPEP